MLHQSLQEGVRLGQASALQSARSGTQYAATPSEIGQAVRWTWTKPANRPLHNHQVGHYCTGSILALAVSGIKGLAVLELRALLMPL